MAKKQQIDFEQSSISITSSSGVSVKEIVDRKTSRPWINWGDDNQLPDHLWDNYLKCSNLQAVINSVVDYFIGEGIETDFAYNAGMEPLSEELKDCVIDYAIFGGFALEGIRNKQGDLVLLKHINVMNVRVNEDLNTAYLSGKWGMYSGKDIIELPLYNKDFKQQHFIFYFRGHITRGFNPVPMYISALKSVEILNMTRNFHLNNLRKGFTASVMISLNNGNIRQRELEKIKKDITDSFCGSDNAGEIVVVNAQDKEHAPTVERLNADNFGDLYATLSDSSKEDIFTAFRISSALVGVNQTTGFQAVEYKNLFNLFYRTVIIPMQNNVSKAMKALGVNVKYNKFMIDLE